MKQLLNAQNVQIAYGESFELVGNAWVDSLGAKYPLSVIGDGCTVADYVPPAPVPEPPAPELRHITKLAFRNRFTAAEKVAVEMAGVDSPSDPMPKRLAAASMRVANADTQAANYIDLDRPDTRAGVQKMEEYGIIGTGRAAQILDAEIKSEERYVP